MGACFHIKSHTIAFSVFMSTDACCYLFALMYLMSVLQMHCLASGTVATCCEDEVEAFFLFCGEEF